MLVYFNGLILGLSLIMALGPQNIFLIRQGALRKHVVLSTFICFICDALLTYASVAGLNHTLTQHPTLQLWLTLFGALFLLYYGINAFGKGLAKHTGQQITQKNARNRFQIILLALGFSLLNPHAIIDSLVIIGGGSSQFPDHQYVFLMGVITSSLLWFTSLTVTTHYFSNALTNTRVWQRVELASGLLMLFLSVKLASSYLFM